MRPPWRFTVSSLPQSIEVGDGEQKLILIQRVKYIRLMDLAYEGTDTKPVTLQIRVKCHDS